MEVIVAAGVVAVAFLALVLLVLRSALALVGETKRVKGRSKVSLYARLNGCGEVRVEVTPLGTTRKAQR